MREIKFRAWNKEHNQMSKPFDIPTLMGKTLEAVKALYSSPDMKELVGGDVEVGGSPNIDGEIMQYTGLKDINNKEIYEGDIVATPGRDPRLGIIQYEPEYAGFYSLVQGLLSCRIDHPIERNIKVVGNVYETPELMEENHAKA